MTENATIDTDTHLADASAEFWSPYVDDPELVPSIARSKGERLLVGDMLLPKPSGVGVGSPLGVKATDSVSGIGERLEFMERLSIRHAFLLPGFVGLSAVNLHDTTARRMLMTAHNRCVHDMAHATSSIEFVPVVAPGDAEWSVQQLERLRSSSLPIRAVVARPTDKCPRPFKDGLENVLLKYLAENDIVLMLHGATGYHQSSPMADVFDDYRLAHVFSHPTEQMIALTDLVMTRSLARGLRIAVLEAGSGWIPWFVGRLQEHFDHTGGCERVDIDVLKALSENVLFSVEPGDRDLESALIQAPDLKYAFGSDYPHWDAANPTEVDDLAERVGPTRAKEIMYGNAAAFFGFTQ